MCDANMAKILDGNYANKDNHRTEGRNDTGGQAGRDESLTEMAIRAGSGTASKDSDVCPKCGGSGWIPYEQDGMLFAKECDCRESDLMSRRLSFANIPDTFKDKELKTLKTSVYATADGKQSFLPLATS